MCGEVLSSHPRETAVNRTWMLRSLLKASSWHDCFRPGVLIAVHRICGPGGWGVERQGGHWFNADDGIWCLHISLWSSTQLVCWIEKQSFTEHIILQDNPTHKPYRRRDLEPDTALVYPQFQKSGGCLQASIYPVLGFTGCAVITIRTRIALNNHQFHW